MSPDMYDRLYTQLAGLIPDLAELQPGDYRKSEAPGFMDLHMDVLRRTPEQLLIALSHTYKQNGDAVPDPDMMIRVYLIPDWKKAEALTYQDARRNDRAYPTADTVDPRMKRSLNAFLKQWLQNLKDQGHSLAPPQAVDATGHLLDIEAQ